MNGAIGDPHAPRRMSINELLNPPASSAAIDHGLPSLTYPNEPYTNTTYPHPTIAPSPHHRTVNGTAYKLSPSSWDGADHDRQRVDHMPYPRGFAPGSLHSSGSYQEYHARLSRTPEDGANIEIEPQGSFLDKLEKRLDIAKTLHRQADHLRKSYEPGTTDVMGTVFETGREVQPHHNPNHPHQTTYPNPFEHPGVYIQPLRSTYEDPGRSQQGFSAYQQPQLLGQRYGDHTHYQPYMYLEHTPPSSRSATRLPYSRSVPPVPYDVPPETAEPTIKKKRKRADTRQLELLNRMYARTAFPTTEERLQLAKELDISARSVQIWFQNKRRAQRQRPSDGQHMPIHPRATPWPGGTPPTAMHPTLSSWLKNMNKLSCLIDRLRRLASATPEDISCRLYRQVDSLRTAFERQQQRYFEFLRLTEEYADQYLLEISNEIEQQSSFLEKLEKRLDMAKTLYDEADNLRKSYESGTMNIMNSIRETALKELLPAESNLIREVEVVLDEISRCYKELDKFWKEEIRRADTAFRTRRVDPDDVERWQNFKASIEQTIESCKTDQQGGSVLNKLHDKRPGSSGGDLGAIVSSLFPAMNALKGSLRRIHHRSSVESPNMSIGSILRAELGLAENNKRCFTFVHRCVEFEEMVTGSFAALINRLACSQSRVGASNYLLQRAVALQTEAPDGLVNNEVLSQGLPEFDSRYKKAVSLKQMTAVGLKSLIVIFSNWVVVADSLPDSDSLQDGFSLGRLRNLADVWEKKSKMRMVLAALRDDAADLSHYLCLSSTPTRSCLARLMTNLVSLVRSRV